MSKMTHNNDKFREGFWERIETLIGEERPFSWAARVGIPKSTFSHCMNNNIVLPLRHLLNVAEQTGVSLSWLVGSEEDEQVLRVRESALIDEMVDYIKALSPEKQAMIRDIIKRIAEEESEYDRDEGTGGAGGGSKVDDSG